MDNPQHYQPLSHALHPPRSIYSTPTTSSGYVQPQNTASDPARPQEEEEEEEEEGEEEEEEEDGDDEGLVEEQLNNDADNQRSNPSSPKTVGNTDTQASYNQPSHDTPQEPERKRRPGRPRGSKNRRPRIGSSKLEGQFYYHGSSPGGAATTSSGPPQHPTMNAQNQQYYEFQWRVLNLCAEFYGAAEELVKGTAPLVVAQCYHMGPGTKVDPLNMLGEAKRICDTLLANPSQLVSNPPPPMYPAVPTLYQSIAHVQPQPIASTSTAPASISALANPPSVITNAQSFVVPLGAQPPYPQYPVYPSAPGQYATTPYYHHQYAPYTAAGTYYPQPHQAQPAPPAAQPQPQPRSVTVAPAATTQPTAIITTTPATGGTVLGNQGAWSDEETERLKKIAEEHRAKGTGEINWDVVIQEWGISRTRHQILIKATALGLKESSTRGVKRRREDGPSDAPGVPSGPSTSNVMMPSTSSPSQSGSTPAASPALQNIQRPSSAKSTAPIAAAPAAPAWPMPVVAVNAPTPAIATAPITAEQQQQRTSYYRPRPNQTDASGKSGNNAAPSQPTVHHFMYNPNGQVGSGLRPKENGK